MSGPASDVSPTSKQRTNSLDLSVVIITRNEQAIVGKCIASALDSVAEIDAEILLVDSASTDRTLEIARQYPIRIMKLTGKSDLSPSAGRYVGTLHTSGRYIFFVDGDMIIIKDWIKRALGYFENKKLAALAGRLYWILPGEELSFLHKDELPLGQLPCLGGAGVYRREVLEITGTFNPFVQGEEERELGFRIRQHSFQLMRIDLPMAYHIAKERNRTEIDEKAKHTMGIGQIFRRYPVQSISWELLKSQKEDFLDLSLLLITVSGLLILLAAKLYVPFFCALALLCLVLAFLVRIKGVKKVYLFFRSLFLMVVHIAKGIVVGIRDLKEYHADVVVIKR